MIDIKDNSGRVLVSLEDNTKPSFIDKLLCSVGIHDYKEHGKQSAINGVVDSQAGAPIQRIVLKCARKGCNHVAYSPP